MCRRSDSSGTEKRTGETPDDSGGSDPVFPASRASARDAPVYAGTRCLTDVPAGEYIIGGAKVRFSNIIIGTLMYAVLNSGLSILGYEPQIQQLIKGIVFLIFVALTIDRKALKVIK